MPLESAAAAANAVPPGDAPRLDATPKPQLALRTYELPSLNLYSCLDNYLSLKGDDLGKIATV